MTFKQYRVLIGGVLSATDEHGKFHLVQDGEQEGAGAAEDQH